MNIYEDIDFQTLLDLRENNHKKTEQVLALLKAEDTLITGALAKKNYKLFWHFAFTRYERKPWHKIQKKPLLINSGDFMKDRWKALDLRQHFRKTGEMANRARGLKYYGEVRFENNSTGDSYLIAGGDFYQNLYGLVWEAHFFSSLAYQTIFSNNLVHNLPYRIDGMMKKFPTPFKDSSNPWSIYYPKLLASQLDVTLNYTQVKINDKNYRYFFREVYH